VHAHAAEVVAETLLHVLAQGIIQRPPTAGQCLVDAGWRRHGGVARDA